MTRSYQPSPNELHACERRPFVVAEHFDADELEDELFDVRLNMRKARFERSEDARVAEAVAHIERIRRDGRSIGPGVPKGYAYRIGQANR